MLLDHFAMRTLPPLLVLPTQYTLLIFGASTSPHSLWRLPLVLTVHVLTYNALTRNTAFPWQPDIGAINNALSVVCSLIATDRLLISRWSWVARGPEAFRQSEKKEDGDLGKARELYSPQSTTKQHPKTFSAFALDLCFNTRGINRPWGFKRVPAFSSFFTTSFSSTPTKTAFLVNRILSMIRCFAILVVVSSLPQHQDPKLFAPDKIPFLSRLFQVEAYEIPLRVVSMFAQRSITFCLVTLVTDVIALITVSIGTSTPAAWPPQFFSPLEAYTVRRYWGSFWHQLIRAPITNNSHALAVLLRLPPHTFVTRYSEMWFAFLLSGYVHLASDLGVGVPFGLSGSLRYYGIQALGIAMEDAVHNAFAQRLSGRGGQYLGRIIGYLWVVTWLSWSGTCWVYPQMYTKILKDAGALMSY